MKPVDGYHARRMPDWLVARKVSALSSVCPAPKAPSPMIAQSDERAVLSRHSKLGHLYLLWGSRTHQSWSLFSNQLSPPRINSQLRP